MKMKEIYYRLVFQPLLKDPNEMLNNMNGNNREEEYEKIFSNAVWNEKFCV